MHAPKNVQIHHSFIQQHHSETLLYFHTKVTDPT